MLAITTGPGRCIRLASNLSLLRTTLLAPADGTKSLGKASGARNSGLEDQDSMGPASAGEPAGHAGVSAGLRLTPGPCRVKSGKRLNRMSGARNEFSITRAGSMKGGASKALSYQ
ncbi:MAG: hypothetical protein ABSF95_05495 [Verrucomicrobiota bacterium]|jgi:hypothetical protein